MLNTRLFPKLLIKNLLIRSLLIVVCLSVWACELGTDPATQISPNYHLLSKCEKSVDARAASIIDESLCGTISVFEDRESKTGRQIDLNIMLLPATSSVIKADPIFFLAGGPGQSAVEAGPGLFSLLKDLRLERDVVFVDQRGTGKSNSLACKLDLSIIESMSLSAKEIQLRQTEGLKKCLSEYDANPALYTTPIAMDDLDEVRSILGYEQINLYGISYGTRAALVYLRRHETSVRSLILDSVVPLSMVVPKNVAHDAQSAFELALLDCKQQSGCEDAYPNLRAHFKALIKRLENTQETITVLHPRTGEQMTGVLDPLAISRTIRGALYDRTLSRLLPLAIEEAYAGNYQPISTLGYVFAGDDGDMGISMGMMASVLCAEDMTLAKAANDSADFDNPMYTSLKPVCKFWPKGDIDKNYFKAVQSEVPVLLTSGELDPITPQKYGWEAALTLNNAKHIVVPGVGHMASIHGCLPTLLAKFLDEPNPLGIDAKCAEKLKRPPFFTSFAGPLSPGTPKEEKND